MVIYLISKKYVEYIMQVPFVAVEPQLVQIILVLVMLPSYYFSLASSP